MLNYDDPFDWSNIKSLKSIRRWIEENYKFNDQLRVRLCTKCKNKNDAGIWGWWWILTKGKLHQLKSLKLIRDVIKIN